MSKDLTVSFVVVLAFIAGIYLIITRTERPNTSADNRPQASLVQDGSAVNDVEEANEPQMAILRQGEGERTSAAGDTLGVYYVGYLENGEIFDSNVDSGQYFQFSLGAGEVIRGWDISLVGMKIGEVRRIVLPPAYAYGDASIGGIPANATLIFDVELREIR